MKTTEMIESHIKVIPIDKEAIQKKIDTLNKHNKLYAQAIDENEEENEEYSKLIRKNSITIENLFVQLNVTGEGNSEKIDTLENKINALMVKMTALDDAANDTWLEIERLQKEMHSIEDGEGW